MQRAKTFFFVSLGILALAGAFHLGARTASGQFGQRAVAFAGPDGAYRVLDDAGNLYEVAVSNGFAGGSCVGIQGVRFINNLFNGPPPSPVVSMLYLNGAYYLLLESGDLYYICHTNQETIFAGNVFGSVPTQTERTTWGRIKAERR